MNVVMNAEIGCVKWMLLLDLFNECCQWMLTMNVVNECW